MEERKRKKAIYARKSKYTGKGESIENQIDTCKHYLKTYFDINITDDDIVVYNDEGYTGANTERPHFKEMMKAIKNNEIDTIICYRLDRISRNVLDFANLYEDWQEHDVNFISVSERFDTTTPMGKAMLFIAITFAQLERDTIAERIRDNMYNRINGSIAENLPHDKILLYGGSLENTSSDYFKENSDESGIFSRYKTQIGHDLTLTWNDRSWWGYDSENKCRIFYPGHLKLSWNGYGVTWVCKDGAHVATLVPTGSTEVLAGTSPASGENWGKEMKSIVLAPQMVDERFFEKNGSIVVAAKTPIPDLFGNVFGKNKFLNFRVDGNLWAVSAARAGYRNGEKYENSKFLNEDEWNLFKDDWEPMFLPVGRCWKSWDGEKFTGDDAYKVLKAVADNLDIDISENGLKLNEKVNLDVLH